MDIIWSYLIATLSIFVMFGLAVLGSKYIRWDKVNRFLFPLAGGLLFIILNFISVRQIRVLHIKTLLDVSNLLLIVLAVIPTSFIMFMADNNKPTEPFKIEEFLNGVSMEIPQRLYTQNLFFILCNRWFIHESFHLGILLNAILWVQFILLQQVMGGGKMTKVVVLEALASFWFSLVAGLLYFHTGNIVIVMATHGLQRYTKHGVKAHFGRLSSKEQPINRA